MPHYRCIIRIQHTYSYVAAYFSQCCSRSTRTTRNIPSLSCARVV